MRRIGMGRVGKSMMSLAGFGAVCVAAAGCQNKVYDENLKLRDQNRELQARLDERHSTPAPPTILEPVKPAPAQTPEVTKAPPEQAPLPPEPVPLTQTPADSGLGGLDTTVDVARGTTTVNLVGDALFSPGQATIKQSAQINLDKVVAALKKQYAGKPVLVQGHTDSDPIRHSKWASNMELSRARADAVRAYLISKGISASRVTAEGLGDTKPKELGTNSIAKAKNRRVEIVVLTRQTGQPELRNSDNK